ncbi:hypothetical protein AB0H76_15260 [Nocardia sp. NPDC050712]|uniref:hypothetical protein n=1 Tax=Nocardia sp. NPDC050712 TaxID=3155518 RepID=UPI0033CCCD0C
MIFGFFTNADVIDAVNESRYATERLDKKMGAVANQLAGVKDQLDKIQAEVSRKGELDADDLAALQAVKDGINAVDALTPDAPPAEPTEPTE